MPKQIAQMNTSNTRLAKEPDFCSAKQKDDKL